MSYQYIVAKNYNIRADFLTDLFNQLVAMGWTLHDDQSASGYQVYKSNGELGDRIYEYIKIDYTVANTIKFYAYGWWNATTHTGLCAAGRAGAIYSGAVTTAETGFTGWIYGNKNLVAIMTKVGTSYYRTFFGHANKKVGTIETDLTASATSGTNVTITVTSTAGFVAGNYYQIFGSVGEGRDWVQVSSITDDTHMVIASLPRNYGIGAKIGQNPSIFGVWDSSTYFDITCPRDTSGTGTSSGYAYVNYSLLQNAYVDPNMRENMYYLQPLMLYEYNGSSSTQDSFTGYNDEYILQASTGTMEDVFYVGTQSSGIATGGDSTTLTDTTKNWTSNIWTNKVVVITAGTGAGQTRKISSNTATSITVASPWLIIPDTTSQYVIADECYRCIYNAVPYIVCKESC